ncbi:MAG: hypothetical protein GXO74_12550 [Calditrichaeota bacterium]|nr:hypothetical protein [Calditrichota bacterium]
MSKKALIFLAIFSSLSFLLFATIPQKINYQGYLTDSAGTPVTTTTPLEVIFTIYDSPTTTTFLWQATYDVSVVNGRFNVVLGNPDKWGNPKEIPYTVFDGNTRYLGIKIGTDPEMTPRKALNSVSYSFQSNNSQQLEGKTVSDFVQKVDNVAAAADGNIDLVAGSNITITPNNSQHKITIASTGGGDNLGNHKATQNIRLNGHWLSNDGNSEGVKVDNSGQVETSGDMLVGDDLTTNGYVWSVGNITSQNGHIKTGNSAPAYVGNGDIYAKNDLYAGAGSIITGSPASVHTNGDIVATDDVLADDDIVASGSVVAYSGGANYAVYGVHGTNYGYLGYGTYGIYGKSSDGVGVYGKSTKSNSYGVYGYNANYYAGAFWGKSGIYAHASNYYGIWASGPNKAGYFQGNVSVSGTLTKGGGAFEIDHPLDPENKYLRHSFVESPDMKNIYDGVAVLDRNGEAEVVLPDWFGALNRDFRYQLTCIGGFAQVYISDEINNNRFKIAGGRSGMKISWQVTGIRHDAFAEAHRIIVEEDKPAKDRGKYLYPKERNMPESMGIDYEETQRIMKEMQHQEPPAPDLKAEQRSESGSQRNN